MYTTAYMQILIFYVPDDLLAKLKYLKHNNFHSLWWSCVIYSSVADVVSFVPQEICWSVLSASPWLLSCPSADIKFITCLINGCHICFSYFGEEKKEKKKKRFTGETADKSKPSKRPCLWVGIYYFCFLKGKGHGQVFGMTSSSHR